MQMQPGLRCIDNLCSCEESWPQFKSFQGRRFESANVHPVKAGIYKGFPEMASVHLTQTKESVRFFMTSQQYPLMLIHVNSDPSKSKAKVDAESAADCIRGGADGVAVVRN